MAAQEEEDPPKQSCELTKAQLSAIQYVRSICNGPQLIESGDFVVTLNFHPDRHLAEERLLLEALAQDNVYYSQFVTGTSNGGLSAFPGGNRWEWESRMFGKAYDDASPHERPIYGALNFRQKPVGAAPRFGSSYFRLHSHVLSRTTFCYPDSVYEPTNFGVLEACDLIPLALADKEKDLLDDYIEAQVHGTVRVDRDIAAVVLDPCYQGTEVEKAARRLPCPIEWHRGYRLSTEVLKQYPEYRGEEYVQLGCEIAKDGVLNPLILGNALLTNRYDPQAIKKIWHYIARYGQL
jgi:hypothetical protein